MEELFSYLSSLTIPDLVLSAAAIVILDLFAFAIILAANRESRLCRKRWEKVGANMELRIREEHFPLEADEILLGRHISADIRLADPSVSRYHAVMTVTGGIWTVTDLDSKGGTFINGQRVRQSRLSPGDTLRLGNLQLRFVKKSAPSRRRKGGGGNV